MSPSWSPKPARLPARPLRTALDEVSALGFDEVLTAALSPAEQGPYVRVGFELVQRLVLLERDLRDGPGFRPAPHGTVLRRPRRSEWPDLVAVDHRAFAPFWRLDAAGVTDAIRATPSARLRVAVTTGGVVVGYAVTGRSGRRGYVQRLAVDPAHEGRGIATSLLLDGLRWVRTRGVTLSYVNTQEANHRALALYRRHGFVPSRHDLAILGQRLPPSGT